VTHSEAAGGDSFIETTEVAPVTTPVSWHIIIAWNNELADAAGPFGRPVRPDIHSLERGFAPEFAWSSSISHPAWSSTKIGLALKQAARTASRSMRTAICTVSSRLTKSL
jgi:hypothetical protein